MKYLLNFGERVSGYDYLVINEREARASAGMMFLLGLLSLFSVYIFRTLIWAELFSITFIIEFFIRTFINPNYAPYMLLGSFIVYKQSPDWVEAKPKRFAWILGMILGATMAYYILFDVISLVRLSICLVCLVLLFMESAFGICLGCLIYSKLNIGLKNCPGGVCSIEKKASYPRYKVVIIILFLLSTFVGYYALSTYKYAQTYNIILISKT